MLGLVSVCCGVLFGVGLALSGMIDPAKVQNFLDVTGAWDPTLALVFAGALSVALPTYQLALRTRERPVAAQEFHLPGAKAITPSLVVGSAVFGVGWGLAGFCPGPGLTALATFDSRVVAFVAAMMAGAALHRFVIARAVGS